MRVIHIFQSETKPKVHGFSEFASGENLPKDSGPWKAIGKTIELPVRKPGLVGLDPEELEANINKHGFHLEEVDVVVTSSHRDA